MRPPVLLAVVFLPFALFAQAPPTQKQAPPPGIAVPDAELTALRNELGVLEKAIQDRRPSREPRPAAEPRAQLDLAPNDGEPRSVADAEIFLKSVRYALDYGEFFDLKQVAAAHAQLAIGLKRAQEPQSKLAPSWEMARGPLVLGYRSKLDDSVQPYGLTVPGDWKPTDKEPRPLWLWFHGRDDKLTELAFIEQRLKGKSEFAPPGAFVMHLYGRYCNASKFAGEIDAFEALADVQARYRINPDRIVVAGFSMGGASAWHMATHHAGLWAAASPGAGFAETATYAKVFDPKKEAPPWWEQVLYRWYDATTVAANLSNLPLIAYSGELDPQMQAAKIMEATMAEEGLKLEHLIGPKTAHKYEPATKKELERQLEAYVTKGREPMPPRVRFVTYTLRYNRMEWLTVDALEKHWERSEVYADLADEGTFRILTKNIAAFSIALPVSPAPLDKTHPPRVVINEQELVGPAVQDRWTAHFRKTDGRWALVESAELPTVTKRHGLTGPIDDAFMDAFLFVRPSGQPLNEKVGAWAKSEMDRAVVEWRRVFRGDVRIKDDAAVTEADIANHNLVLWGDPSSNKLLGRIHGEGVKANRRPMLPLVWTADELRLGGMKVSSSDHAPVMVFPNPLNPQRYIVLNSGFTFRQGSTTSNSLQTPKLPDWAVIDLREPPSAKWPGLVVDAGFFDESWQIPR
jgi:hypothetical protein